jgi:hypothetical protein
MARLPGARPFALPSTSGGFLVASGAVYVLGWAFKESTGSAAASVDIYDGLGTGGVLIAPISLSSGESTRDYPPPPGIECRQGCYVNIASGGVVGSLWALMAVIYDEYALVEGDIPIDSYRA